MSREKKEERRKKWNFQKIGGFITPISKKRKNFETNPNGKKPTNIRNKRRNFLSEEQIQMMIDDPLF